MDRMQQNRSNAAKSIERSNYKQGRTFSFITQVLNNIIQFLPCHVLVLSFVRILNHTEHFIEERCSYYSLSMDTPCFQDGRCNLGTYHFLWGAGGGGTFFSEPKKGGLRFFPNSYWYIIKVWVSFHWLTDKTGTTVLEGRCHSQELNWSREYML